MQTVIVFILIAVSVAYLISAVIKYFKKKKTGCSNCHED
ncbi:MAG: FeoB-associated Cys-rich membrane protein [Candidatus Omnitrophica bacterium]|nr:FeoB-associated Cys-rich membrane protein [Candidatus Omnitrophota bacterium]